jgi:hypothetical protein
VGTRAVVASAVVLAVVVGGALVADGVVRERAETDLASSLTDQVPGLASEPDVTIEGFPFLTQVLAGELQHVRIAAPTVTVEGMPLHDVVVDLEGVSTDRPTTARLATMTASASLGDLSDQLAMDADLTVEDGLLVATTSFLGLPVAVRLTPRPAGRAIEADVESFALAGVTVQADALPDQLTDRVEGLSVPVDGLPAGMILTGLVVTSSGVDLEAGGEDVVLDQTLPE